MRGLCALPSRYYYEIMKNSILALAVFISGLFLSSPAEAATYYASKTGNNSDGKSWTTAWNELNQINWSIVQPGDTIELDGGPTSCDYPVTVTDTGTSLPANCGMVYVTTLTVGKSGQNGKEIIIQLSSEPGRNGTARIWGGRTNTLPYCGQPSYDNQTARDNGINISNHDYITVDGHHWSGIMTYSVHNNGVHLNNSDYITIKNIETFDNGRATTLFLSDGSWSPEKGSKGVGVFFTGYHQKFERIISHDNANDSFQSYGPMGDITLERVWAFNSRPAANDPTEAFSACTHSDGLQVWEGGLQSGILFQNSIVGPGFNQGFILGDYGSVNATIDNVTVRNTTFLSHHGPWSTAALYTKWASGNSLRAPQNYLLENVTVVRDKDDGWWSTKIDGTNHTVKNSLFYGIEHGAGIQTNVMIAGNPVVNNNICYRVNNSSSVCNVTNVNPNFVDDNYSGIGTGFADFDFTITNPAIASGIGSTITSVAVLLGEQVSPSPSKSGDANGDDRVDGMDYVIWLNHYGQTISGIDKGDFDSNNKVDGIDYVLWLNHYGQ